MVTKALKKAIREIDDSNSKKEGRKVRGCKERGRC